VSSDSDEADDSEGSRERGWAVVGEVAAARSSNFDFMAWRRRTMNSFLFDPNEVSLLK